MNVYDMAFDAKSVRELETHTLQLVVVLLTVSELMGHLPSNALVNKFEHLREKNMRFPAL